MKTQLLQLFGDHVNKGAYTVSGVTAAAAAWGVHEWGVVVGIVTSVTVGAVSVFVMLRRDRFAAAKDRREAAQFRAEYEKDDDSNPH